MNGACANALERLTPLNRAAKIVLRGVYRENVALQISKTELAIPTIE